MDIERVIKHFGSITKTAEALGVTYQSVHQWQSSGRIPPGRQWQILAITNGAFSPLGQPKVDQTAESAS